VDLVPVDQLEREWKRQLASGTIAQHLYRWQLTEPALAPFSSPNRLMSYLRNSPGGQQQDGVLGALVRTSRTDPVAATLLLQRLLPGLKRRAGQLILDAADREEVWALLLAQLWERVRTFPIERRPHHVAASLLLDSFHETWVLLTEERERAVELTTEPPEGVEAPDGDGGDIDRLLQNAVESGAITREEACLIAETRIDGVPLGRAAAARGVSRHALVMRRVRAEQRLFLNLGWGRVTFGGSKPPLCSARVSGAGSKGLAGGEDQPTPRRR
jgi:hypothetical protein